MLYIIYIFNSHLFEIHGTVKRSLHILDPSYPSQAYGLYLFSRVSTPSNYNHGSGSENMHRNFTNCLVIFLMLFLVYEIYTVQLSEPGPVLSVRVKMPLPTHKCAVVMTLAHEDEKFTTMYFYGWMVVINLLLHSQHYRMTVLWYFDQHHIYTSTKCILTIGVSLRYV